MSVRTAVVGAISIATVLVALTTIAVLSELGDGDIAVEPLMVGDLRQLLGSNTFWRAFPTVCRPESLLEIGPLVVVVGLGTVLYALQCRQRPLTRTVSGAMAITLALGLVPYAIGALALRGNTRPELVGRWLAWMSNGPLYSALLALAVLVLRPGLSSLVHSSTASDRRDQTGTTSRPEPQPKAWLPSALRADQRRAPAP
ncbi:MAG: hypothetical protein R3F56_25105 [Planctomycetota bacterium]